MIKEIFKISAGILILIIIALVGLTFKHFQQENNPIEKNKKTETEQNLSLPIFHEPQTGLNLYLAQEQKDLIRGLSGLSALQNNHGLLMIYKQEDYHGIWMPDMNFAIDVLWLNEDGIITDRQINMKPGSYPEVFTPPNRPSSFWKSRPA
ncbi:MAG: DUF192 domain-containing protein [Patescibacteria group bacterium]